MTADRDVLELARSFVTAESAALAGVAGQLDDSFVRVVHLVSEVRGKVVTTAVGTSGAIARRMAHLLSLCGTPSVFIHSTEALHGSLGAFTEDDVLIAFSKGGQTEEVTGLCARARDRGVPIVAVTSRVDTPFADLADVLVLLDADGADPGGLIAMSSTLAVAAWGDALAVALMRMRGRTFEMVKADHPGGLVGKSEVPDTESWPS